MLIKITARVYKVRQSTILFLAHCSFYLTVNILVKTGDGEPLFLITAMRNRDSPSLFYMVQRLPLGVHSALDQTFLIVNRMQKPAG